MINISTILFRTLALATVLATLHELGHAAAMLAFGAGVSKIALGSPVLVSFDLFGAVIELGLPIMGFGTEAVRATEAMSPAEIATIAAAGPLVSFLCVVMLKRLGAKPWATELAWGLLWLQAIPWPGIDAFTFLNGVARLFPVGTSGLVFVVLIAAAVVANGYFFVKYLAAAGLWKNRSTIAA